MTKIKIKELQTIDTAQVYKNESYIGNALQGLLEKYQLSRNQIYITSKIGKLKVSAKQKILVYDDFFSS